MLNLIGIGDKVKVQLKGEGRENVLGNGADVTIISVLQMQGDIYYTGNYTYNCPISCEENESSIQFKEGEYIVIEFANQENE